MIKFEIADGGTPQPKRASLRVSGSGDLWLLLNGVCVCGIDASSGTLLRNTLKESVTENLGLMRSEGDQIELYPNRFK